VKRVRARLTDRVYYRASATELRAISVHHRLKFGYCFDSERGTDDGSDAAIPEGLHILAVKQQCLTFRPSTRHRIRVRPALKTGGRY